MKKYKMYLGLFLLLATFGFVSCNETEPETKEVELIIPKIDNQEEALLNFFKSSGDYINAANSPYLIAPDDVKDNLDKYLIIDIRFHEDYVKGHIDGAINVDREKIIDFLKSLNIYQYEKIIIVDNTGQGAAYVSSILRAIGYGNIYPMKYGMASWNKVFAYNWTEKIGDKYSQYITKKEFKKNPKGKFPVINTSGKTISEILDYRAKEEINYNFSVTIDNLIPKIDDYYIINYWPKAKYDEAHLVGARWYQPKKSMNPDEDLATIPTNKKVLVYCYSGQVSSAVVGYLRLLGYDAYSLRFGANSFMHRDAVANGWHGFVAAERVHTYPLVEGEKPSKEKESKANKIKNPDLNFKHRKVVQPDPDEVCD